MHLNIKQRMFFGRFFSKYITKNKDYCIMYNKV